MSVKEACEALGISRATLMRRVEDGTLVPLPKPKVLKRHYKLAFRREDVEKLLETD